MIKNLSSGSIINYGATFPNAASAFDGTLFYKSSGANQGLYIFSMNQDVNSGQVGDQVSQTWNAVTSPNLYVAKAGDTMGGDLTIQTDTGYRGLRVLNVAGQSGGSFGATIGINQGIVISGEGGPISFSAGNTQRMVLSTAGNLTLITSAGTGTVWTNLNDGAGSGLDADLLDGQNSTFFQNATNITSGTLAVARLPFTPVQQGGGTGQLNNKVYIGLGSDSKLHLQIDTTDWVSTWPISITGSAASATTATSATTASSAATLTTARTITLTGDVTGAVSFNGSANVSMTTTVVNDSHNHTVISLADGTAVDPPLSFGNDANTGLFRVEENVLGVAAGGALVGTFQNIGDEEGLYMPTDSTIVTGGWSTKLTANGGITIATSGGLASPPATNPNANDLVITSAATSAGAGITIFCPATEYGAIFFGDTASSIAGQQRYNHSNDSFTWYTNTSLAMTLSSANNLTVVGDITAFSDARTKTDVEPIQEALNKVKALNGVSYRRINTQEYGTGLIAQNVREVVPEAVKEDEETGMLSVAYGNLVGLLVEAIKELNLKVETLQAKLDSKEA